MIPKLVAEDPRHERLQTVPLIHSTDIAFFDDPVYRQIWFSAAGMPYRALAGQTCSQADCAFHAVFWDVLVAIARISHWGIPTQNAPRCTLRPRF